MRTVYAIKLPMDGTTELFTVCRAYTPEAAGDVVRALLSARSRTPETITVSVEQEIEQ